MCVTEGIASRLQDGELAGCTADPPVSGHTVKPTEMIDRVMMVTEYSMLLSNSMRVKT